MNLRRFDCRFISRILQISAVILKTTSNIAVPSPNFAHFCKDSCRGARVAQICNLLYRRIAFGGAPAVAKSSASDAASGLQIRDTAEYNAARLWLRLRRARPPSIVQPLFCEENRSVNFDFSCKMPQVKPYGQLRRGDFPKSTRMKMEIRETKLRRI
jgi:hypothetical protein